MLLYRNNNIISIHIGCVFKISRGEKLRFVNRLLHLENKEMQPFTIPKDMRQLLILLVSISTLALQMGCGSMEVSKGFYGNVKDGGNMRVFIDKVSLNRAHEVIANAETDADGNFSIPLEEKLETGLYRLRVGTKKAFVPIDGTETSVEIMADLNKLDQYGFTVEGAPGCSEALGVIQKLVRKELDAPGVQAEVGKMNSSMAAMTVAYLAMGGQQQFLDFYKSTFSKLKADHPSAPITNEFGGWIGQIEQKVALANSGPVQVGKPVPDISLPSPEGKVYTLSELKGKVVLIDFWASWCGPCRRENPHVVKLYDKYNKKGFEVFSVSLDRQNQKQRWVDAIKKDNLKWPYHVSDLKFWSSIPAKMYGVNSIPRTFLIDRDGNLVAKNLRGTQIEKELEKLL